MARYTKVGDLTRVHLRIDFLEEGEEEYLDFLLSAVECAVEKELNQPLSNLENDKGELAPNLVMAILMQVATLYANRESVSYGKPEQVPLAYGWLIQSDINVERKKH